MPSPPTPRGYARAMAPPSDPTPPASDVPVPASASGAPAPTPPAPASGPGGRSTDRAPAGIDLVDAIVSHAPGVAPASRPLMTFLGHATIFIDMDGTQVLTDPLLHGWVGPLQRRRPRPDPKLVAAIDAVLISHLHLDHLDFPSLELLGREKRILVPEGAERLMEKHGFHNIRALAPGESERVGALSITATPAVHSGFRPPLGPRAIPVGFIVEGSRRIYFAGDTGIFRGMADLADPHLDVALLPVWGWGPKLSQGHLHPASAAKALQYLRPTAAVPIHWGTLWPVMPALFFPSRFHRPPHEFAEHAANFAPDVRILVTTPGDAVDFR
jgi:L-ascorbate metabolism protein UlaG (beta-lactamase superfamily)